MSKLNKTLVRIGFLAVALLVGLVACGGAEEAPDNGETAEPGEVVTVEAEPTEEIIKGDEGELETIGGGYIYRREGGIAGFCDVITVQGGTATIATCAQDPPATTAELTLSLDQSQLVNTWLEELASFEHEEKDPAEADAMTILITFEGQGDNEVTDDILATMEELALELLESSREE